MSFQLTRTLVVLVCAPALQLRAQQPTAASAAAPASPPEAQSEKSLASLADTPHVCGLGAAFHGGRRALLAEKLVNGVILVRGLPKTRDYARFRQDKTFWYLTGVESPDATLLVDVEGKREALFLPSPSAIAEQWEGEIWDSGDAWVPALTGFRDVRPSKELEATLKEWTAKDKLVWISKLPHVELAGCCDRASLYDGRAEKDALDGRPSREDALENALRKKYGLEVKDFSSTLSEMRRIKTPEEIAAMRRAAVAGADAMKEAIRSTRPGLGEWELESLMTFVHRQEGADGPAYHAIVGSGPNALLLHYSDCTRRMKEREMLLIDYAPEFDHYTSDITRSWPTDGVFTPRMAEIYDAVLAAQEAGIAAVKPGATMRDVDRACRKVLSERGLSSLMPHGACHYIGMEVHDVGVGGAKLEPGVAFTVEPGVYDPDTGIGVRIEDVVVVTEAGCEVISSGVPKDRAAIVALFREAGLLDRVHARDEAAPEASKR